MKIYVLIAEDNIVNGVYSSRDKLLTDLTTSLSNLPIKNIEIWDVDSGFVGYLKVNKTTTITIEN